MANRKDMNKRRMKAAQKQQQKRKAKVAALRKQPQAQVHYRPGITEMGAPEGFRAIGMAHAMMEYGKPIMKLTKGESDLNPAIQATMLLWNHALAVEKGEADRQETAEVVNVLSKTFGLKEDDAEKLRARMVERRKWLFPEEVQPRDKMSMFMIMRKEKLADIRPFAYDRLRHTEDPIPPDNEDRAFVDKLTKLDQYMENEADYGEYEKLLTETKDLAEDRFRQWFKDRGFPQEFHQLPGCVYTYFDFIYGYMHDNIVTLKSVTPGYLTEYFEDFLIRKVYCEPQEYVDWPPAIKLFYLFLKDKGYMEDIASVTSMLNVLERRFMGILKKQFS